MTREKLFRLSRPRFWIYVFGPYIVGLVAGAAHLNDLRTLLVIAFGLFFLFPANILIYGVNDVFDYETDIRNVKKERYETLLHPPERPTLWKIVALTNFPFLLLLPFSSTRCVGAMAGFLFFSLFYSAPPIRAKSKPILDSIFNVLYVFPGVFAYFLVGGHNFNVALFVAAWCWAMAMHAYSAAPDISADRQANVPTVATFLGFYGTLLFCTALYIASTLIAFRVLGRLTPLLGIIYIALMVISLRSDDEDGVRQIYKWFPIVNTTVGFVLFWAIVIARFFHF